MSTLKVIFWNVWCLPQYFTDGKYASDERAKLIVPYLKGYDLILLCEAWTNAAKSVFLAETKTEYPYQFTDDADGIISFGTGLMVLSKYPLINPSMIIYDMSADWDWFSNKGAFHFQINPDNTIYDFFLTHMQATYADTFLPCFDYSIGSQTSREYQSVQLSNFINKQLKNNNSANVFAIGDYNIMPYLDEDTQDQNFYNDMVMRAACYEMIKHQIAMIDLQTIQSDVFHYFTKRLDTKNITVTNMDQHGLSDGEYVLIEVPLKN